MKLKLKAILAAVTFAFAGTALADINPGNIVTAGPQQGNGELFLSVWNNSLGQSYTRDLGINLSNFLPTGTAAPVNAVAGNGVDYAFGAAPTIGVGNVLNPGYLLTFGLDASPASSILATLLSTSGTVWSVIGAENFGNDRLLFTSNQTLPSFATSQLQSGTSNIATHLGAVNLLQTGAADPTANGSSTATPPSVAFSGTALGVNATISGLNTVAAVGQSLDFWFANQTGTTTSTISQFGGGEWLLASDGTLSWNVEQVSAPIPEPGTWAMLMAGLAMVGGIARRRTQA